MSKKMLFRKGVNVVNIKKYLPQIAAFALVFVLAAVVSTTVFAKVAQENELKNITGVSKTGSLKDNIILVINWILGFVGLVAVVMLVYGGFTYVISGGDEQKLESAKNTIIYAVIGIVVVLLAFVIVRAVGGIL